MASATSILPITTGSRRRSFFSPREHGGWGMLLVPLVTGAVAGNPPVNRIIWIFLFAVVALGLFCLRTPVEAGLQISPSRPQNDGERRLIYFSIFIYSFRSVLALTVLLLWVHVFGLLLLGAASAIAFLFQAVLKSLGRRTRMSAQLTGAIALSSTSAGAYYLATGHWGRMAVIVWLANWLFVANQIRFVRLRIHSARALTPRVKFSQGKGFLVHQAVSLLILGLVWRAGWLPGLIVVAFSPLLVRGIVWFLGPHRPLQVRRLGTSELLYALVFGMFFIAGFHHPIR